MIYYSEAEGERAMKVQEVILRAMSGEILWVDAADILGISPRSMRRWRARYEKYGYDGLYDRRKKMPSPKRVPMEEVEKVLRLYRERYFDFNVRHYHEKLVEEHGIRLSYTWVKTALQTAGLVPKRRRRSRHRKERPRKSLVGMMLHLDGSEHSWLPGRDGERQDLLVIMDDATSEIYDIFLVEEESTRTVMEVIKRVVKEKGIFCSLYTDRARHFAFTPKAGGKPDLSRPTQVARAVKQLGIKLILAYSSEARGRSERMFGTLQGRLPQEFRIAGIKTMEEANKYLRKVLLKKLNKKFSVKPQVEGTAFVPAGDIDLDKIFSIQHERTVNNDNTVSYANKKLQIEPNILRVTFAKCRVTVYEHLDGTISIGYGPHTIGRYNKHGEPLKKRTTRARKNRLSEVYLGLSGDEIVTYNTNEKVILADKLGFEVK
jgi:transposase